MKKKIIIAVAALMLFAFSIAVFAYTSTPNNPTTKCCQMSDCCKDGECKMNHSCCKDKDSCPMKAKESASGETKDCPMKKDKEMSATHNHEGKSCCDKADCCKDGKCQMNGECCKNHDSCPMKAEKKDGETKDCPMHNKGKSKDN
jgi:hypothetical protein